MFAFIKRIYLLLIGTAALRYSTLPVSADGVTAAAVTATAAAVAWTWGAWAQISAATSADSKLVALTLEDYTGAASQGEVEIGTGAGGSESAIVRIQATAGGMQFTHPVHIASGTRVACRYRTSTGAADTVGVKLNTLTGF